MRPMPGPSCPVAPAPVPPLVFMITDTFSQSCSESSVIMAGGKNLGPRLRDHVRYVAFALIQPVQSRGGTPGLLTRTLRAVSATVCPCESRSCGSFRGRFHDRGQFFAPVRKVVRDHESRGPVRGRGGVGGGAGLRRAGRGPGEGRAGRCLTATQVSLGCRAGTRRCAARGAEPGHPHGLGQRRVRLGGDVDAVAAVDAVVAPRAGWPRCSAASSATSAADDAESWITPPPPPPNVNAGSRPSAPASASSSACSTSVAAGEVDQSIPCAPSPPESRSPRSECSEALAGK